MKFVALIKTWDGEEWIEPCLESIYGHVDRIVLVHSETSWLGEKGNRVEPVARAWSNRNDSRGKVDHVSCDTMSQEEQYAIGLRHIEANHIPCDVVMVVDADEIWTEGDLQKAKSQIEKDKTPALSYRVNMQTYLKTPFYQVHPPYGEVLAFFRFGHGSRYLTQRPRGQGCPSKPLTDVWFHHFTYVRKTPEDVFRKIRQSSTADGDKMTPNWDKTIWDRLPFANDLHGCDRWKHVWKSVIRVFRHEIPIAAWKSDFMATFLARCDSLLESEMDCIRELTQGKSWCVDLGTLQGTSAAIMSLGAGQVDTFDLFEDVPRHAVIHEIDGEQATFATIPDRVTKEEVARRNLSWYPNVRVNKSDVIAAADRFDDGSIDLVFVDADHSCECTLGCANVWTSKIKPGGMLLFHDHNDGNPGVIEAVKQVSQNPQLVRAKLPNTWPGSLVGFNKR